jgi:hypothetical protein
MQALKDSRGSGAIVDMLDRLDLSRFEATYVSLATLLKRLRPAAQKIMFNTPPRQTTVPGDPTYSGGSTGTSSSLESKPETYAQNIAMKFIEATCLTIRKWLDRIEWVAPAAKLCLSPQYVNKFVLF